jgi:hypothetical protein
MPTIPITYLVSSPFGDVPADADKMHLPLECDPFKTPYGKYFNSMEEFLKRDEFNGVLTAVSKKTGREISPDEISEILIRAEKHGLLYHPASVELILRNGGGRVKFGLNVAVSGTGVKWLHNEISSLRELHDRYRLPYLPEVYFSGDSDSMVFLLEDWFEDYHEFHISRDEDGSEALQLWKFGGGYLNLTGRQAFEIYRQASKILTLYYDFEDFNYIYPWHHAAGDFIVRIVDSEVDVRLTTARSYTPLLDFQRDEINPLFAVFYFFLHLSLHMRLDKIDGVGEVAWAEDSCVDAAVQGFCEALRKKENFKKNPERYEEFISLLKSFTPEELKTSYSPLLGLYEGTKDLPVVADHLAGHTEKLHSFIQTRL